jgi:hypothetical protein
MQAQDIDYRDQAVNLRGYLRLGRNFDSTVRAALYSAQADRRSWASMRSLFDEVL